MSVISGDRDEHPGAGGRWEACSCLEIVSAVTATFFRQYGNLFPKGRGRERGMQV